MTRLRPRHASTLAFSGLAILAVVACGPSADGDAHARAESAEAEEGATEVEAKKRVETPVPTEKPRGNRAPDFHLTLLDGTAVALSDYAGQVVLIDFWATWCGPCRMAIPHLIELQSEYEGDGFTVLGVSLDRAGVKAVDQYAKKAGINYPVGLGNKGIAHAYGGVQSIPMAFLVDRDGYVAKVIRGYQPKSAIESALLPLLREQASAEG